MAKYTVTMPMGGHVIFTGVEANSKEEAIAKIWEGEARKCKPSDGEQQWEYMEGIGEGNVCSHPSPWNPEAEEET